MDLKTLKSIARDKLAYAVKIGRIKKPIHCEGCNRIKVLQGHHPDYARPLRVFWLCRKCHAIIHGLKRRGKKYRSRRSKGHQSSTDSGSERDLRV